MGTVVHSVGIGGTHDYTSLQAWADALPANLSTDGNAQRAELYFNGPGDGEFINSATFGQLLNLTGHATDPTNSITITTAPGQSFRDNASVRTNPLRYDATKGVALRCTANYSTVLSIQNANVIVSNLQISCSAGGNPGIYHSTGGTSPGVSSIENCIIKHNWLSRINCSMKNCFVYSDVSGNRVLIIFEYGQWASATSCTFAVCSDQTNTSYILQSSYGSPVSYVSCAFFCPAYPLFGTSVFTNCATNAASSTSGLTGSLTYSDQFIGTTSSAPDFRLKPGSYLIDGGEIGANTTGIKLVSSYSPGFNRSDFTGGVGVSFVPTINISLNKLGLRCAGGNTGAHTVELRDWANPASPTLLRSAVVDLTGGTIGTFYYAPTGLITLIAGHHYYLGAVQTFGVQNWAEEGPVTLLNATTVYSAYIIGSAGTTASADKMYVGVDFDLDPLVTDISGGARLVGFGYDIGAWEYVAGLVTHSVGIGGTHDYTSLSAWAAALPANIVVDGNAQRAELYFNGSGDGEFLSTSGHLLQLTGHTTDRIHTIKITTGPGQSFRDNASVRTNSLRYDASKGVALRCFAGYSNVVNLRDNNVIFENLQFMGDSGNYATIDAGGNSVSGYVATFNNCLIWNHTGVVTSTVFLFNGFDNAIFRNCIIIHDPTGIGGAGVVVAKGGEYYFCTFVVPSGSAVTGATAAIVPAYAGTPCIVKNCAFFGFAQLHNNQVPTFSNCATDLASPPSGVTGGLTYANQFEDITVSGGFDFRSKRGAFLRGGGAADALNGAFDISGLARPTGGAWDIGAWELAFGTVTHSIGIGGTHDYTSLAAWAAALPASLLTDANAQRAELYFNGTGDGEFVTSGASLLTLTGHTTTSSHAITITTGPGQSFRDRTDVRTNALRYDPSKGVALLNTLFYGYGINNNDSYVTISNLQIKETAAPGATIESRCSGPFTVENCILESTGISGNNWATLVIHFSSQAIVRNCVIINSTVDSSASIFLGSQSTYFFYFCTFVRPSNLTPLTQTAVRIQFTNTVTFNNCAVFGATNAVSSADSTFAITGSVTDQASPPAGFTTVAYANQFENALSTAQDWRLKRGSALRGLAIADSVNGAIDISGLPRPQGGLWDIGAWALAFGTTTHSIGTGGTHDYTSLAAWAAALPANLITDANAQRAELYFNGPGDGEFVTAAGNILTLTGHTTNPLHTITLTTAPGQSFRDHANVRTNALTYDASKGVGIRTTGPNYATTMSIGDDNVFLSNLQIQNTVYSSSVITHTGIGKLVADNCIFTGGIANLNQNFGSSSIFNNCLFEHIATFGHGVIVNRGTNHFNFCTFVEVSDLGAAADAVQVAYETSYFTNCAIFGSANAISIYASTIISTNCATNDTTPLPGFTSMAFTDQFVGTTSTAPDWRLKAGAGLIGAGVVIPTVLTDISKVLRDSVVDVGAWEFAAAGSPPQALFASLFAEIIVKPNLPRIV